MEYIAIDKKHWQEINQRLTRMESLLETVIKQQNEVVIPAQEGWISIEDAMKLYHTSRKTLNKKAQKYKISRLPSGGLKLLNSKELAIAMQKKEPKPLFLQGQE